LRGRSKGRLGLVLFTILFWAMGSLRVLGQTLAFGKDAGRSRGVAGEM
jgi:hypothetical protein